MKLEKPVYAKCIKEGVHGLEVGRVYEVLDEDRSDIEIFVGREPRWIDKDFFEPYEEPVNLETIKKQIDQLEKELYHLKDLKEEMEKEQMKIRVGSIIRSEDFYANEVEEYRIVVIQPEPMRKYKFGLLDENSCIWSGLIFNSLEEIKKMMKEDKDLEWSVVKL